MSQLSEGTRRAFLMVQAAAERSRDGHRVARIVQRRRRAAALRVWKAAALGAKLLSQGLGGACRQSSASMKRRGFAAVRATAAAAKVASTCAGLTASGRKQLVELAQRRALSKLSRNATEARIASSRTLLAGQRGFARQVAALQQPLRHLLVRSMLVALHTWHAASKIAHLDRAAASLDTALKHELGLKRRAHEDLLAAARREVEQQRQRRAEAQLVSNLPRRTALDKLFGLVQLWEIARLRPALVEWRRAAKGPLRPLGNGPLGNGPPRPLEPQPPEPPPTYKPISPFASVWH